MPADPNFDNLAVESYNPDGYSYMDNSPVGFVNFWAHDGSSVGPAGTVGPPTFTRQLLMECCWPEYDINYFDGTFHHTCAKWNALDSGPDSFDALVGDAADAALAAHPDIDYFTLEPQGAISLNDYQIACPSAYSFFGPPNPPTNPLADAPHSSVLLHPVIENRGHEYDSGDIEIAVNHSGVWYVDDHWGPDVGAPYSDTFPTFAGLGTIHANEAYLLRPTALTWVAQDPSNTANRIFWERADIPDTIAHTINWHGGHPAMTTWISVRGWKLFAGTIEPTQPVICFV